MLEGNQKVAQLQALDVVKTRAVKDILRCSTRLSITAIRAELEIYPPNNPPPKKKHRQRCKTAEAAILNAEL